MNYLLAIIGREGSGKSTLCQAFEKVGVRKIDFNELIYKINDKEQFDQDTCLLVQPRVIDLVRKELSHCRGIVEIPSTVNMQYLCKGESIFRYIVSVDCPEWAQRVYLEKLGHSTQRVEQIINSGYDRRFYTSLASDVFLNTVSLEHVEWVAHKLYLSYQLIEQQGCI